MCTYANQMKNDAWTKMLPSEWILFFTKDGKIRDRFLDEELSIFTTFINLHLFNRANNICNTNFRYSKLVKYSHLSLIIPFLHFHSNSCNFSDWCLNEFSEPENVYETISRFKVTESVLHDAVIENNIQIIYGTLEEKKNSLSKPKSSIHIHEIPESRSVIHRISFMQWIVGHKM